jgi:transposase
MMFDMRRIVVRLSNEEREVIDRIRSKGVHPARQVTRAHILGALDRGIPDPQVSAVLGVSRKVVWRTRSAYQERGVSYALEDVPRAGAPRKYEGAAESEVAALASSPAPAGAKRWTIKLVVQEARKRPGLAKINRESVRQFLKKTS